MSTATNQLFILNLSERRGAARLMSAREIYAQSQGLERDEGLRNDGRRRRKGDDMSNRTGRGSTAKRAVLETVCSRVVVPMMRRHLRLVRRGTQFEQKRRTARRHEADRHVGTKQEDDQQQAGE
jgi:hypothetical protein